MVFGDDHGVNTILPQEVRQSDTYDGGAGYRVFDKFDEVSFTGEVEFAL